MSQDVEVQDTKEGRLVRIVDIIEKAGDEPELDLPIPITESDDGKKKDKITAKRVLLLASLYLAFFLPTFNQTIVSTSSAKILSDINVNSSDIGYTWVGSIYPLSQSMVLPMFTHLAVVWRRKRMFLVAMVIFIVGSAIAGSAYNLETLISARVIQGIGAGGISGAVMILLHDLIIQRGVHLGRYHDVAATTWALASALGPVLGGVFAEKTSWRWCFFMNIPICVFCIVVVSILLPPVQPTSTLKSAMKSVDTWGVMAVATGKILIMLGFQWVTQGEEWGSPEVLTVLLGGLAAIAAFVRVEFVTPQPVVPFRLFDHRTRVGAYLATFFHAIAFSGLNYWLPLYFQGVRRQSSSESGISMLPWIVAFGVTSAVGGLLIEGIKRYQELIWSGFVVATIGCGLLNMLNYSTSLILVYVFLVIAGIGIGPNFSSLLVPIHASISDSVHKRQDIVSLSTSAFVFLRTFGSSVGISISGIVFFQDLAKNQMPSLTVFNLTQAIEHPDDLTKLEEDANLVVLSSVMHHVFLQVVIVVAAGMLMSFIIAEHKFNSGDLGEEERPAAGRADSFGLDGA